MESTETMTMEQTMEEAIALPVRGAREKFGIWFHQNRFLVFGTVSAVAQAVFIGTVVIKGEILDAGKEIFSEVSFVTDLKFAQPKAAVQVPEGEIKATDKVEKKEKKEDPRIASAQNPFFVGAVMPRDLTPHIRPQYTAAARKANAEGRVMLTVWIADTGEVLKVRILGRKKDRLGYGLERAAVRAFYRKKFKPATLKGKPVTVKINIPVRFTLG